MYIYIPAIIYIYIHIYVYIYTCASVIPSRMSTGTLMIFSGFEMARSSMEVPPSAQATRRGPIVLRSSVMEKYLKEKNRKTSCML